MIEVTSQQGAVLAFISLFTMGFICALCVCCKKKSLIVQENNQLYIPQILNVAHTSHSHLESAVQDLEGSYQNISKRGFIDPIATPPTNNSVLDSEYANIYRPDDIDHDSSEDYENTEFLQKHQTDDNDESDYVNIDSSN
ncbi:hypothetical protein QTP70_028042 [Hemibagrus guttatus]|uniref:Linker for activation of T-cells family member 2 n=1 Tax=Hemibagrus guttatus TaxID=175788 RepID=A0AAE0QMM6_9TELE|nr:hypothetical protein QTP70_028042 [Hemibagrus guttatus]KAK3555614.1 hypothetical protein QTP86_025645 [Hemibagrus guttatus]